MYSLKNVKSRWFELQLPTNKILHLEQPKLKVLAKIEKMGGTVEEMSKVIAQLMSKNREGFKVTADNVQEWMTAEQCGEFLDSFVSWTYNEKAADPN